MKRFQPKMILCPTDFSEMATFALQYAKDIATSFGGRLVVLYAESFIPPPYFTSAQEDELVKSLKRSQKAASDHLARYVQEHVRDSVKAEALVVDQLTVPAILNTAEQREVDVIVMGTYGRSGLSRVRLGSVTERVLRETDRPLITIRYKEGASEPSTVSIKQILCPVNFTEVARKALEHAVAMAECFGAELMVLNVVESPASQAADPDELDRLCRWIPDDFRPHCSFQETIRRGDAAEQIIGQASSTGCDLIVLGAQHKRFFDTTVIGTTTVNVTRHAPCPVLVVIRK
jgi:nucleotide-binding universal stress UspA family protein